MGNVNVSRVLQNLKVNVLYVQKVRSFIEEQVNVFARRMNKWQKMVNVFDVQIDRYIKMGIVSVFSTITDKKIKRMQSVKDAIIKRIFLNVGKLKKILVNQES